MNRGITLEMVEFCSDQKECNEKLCHADKMSETALEVLINSYAIKDSQKLQNEVEPESDAAVEPVMVDDLQRKM